MRLVVVGRKEQVARSLAERSAGWPDVEAVTLQTPEFDLRQPKRVERAIVAANADIVVSAATYAAVDAAEDDLDAASAVNEAGVEAVARAARLCGVPVIDRSTDYVCSGECDRHYREDMTPAPRNAGEKAVRAGNPNSVILRSRRVYGPFGSNLARTMLRLSGERDTAAMVDDPTGNPTSCLDIAEAVLRIARVFRPDDSRAGIYHYVGVGDATWCGLTLHVLAESAARGEPQARARDRGIRVSDKSHPAEGIAAGHLEDRRCLRHSCRRLAHQRCNRCRTSRRKDNRRRCWSIFPERGLAPC